MAKYNTGDAVKFTYRKPTSKDKNPSVLIITPNLDGKLHGVNLNYLSENEKKAILSIFRSVNLKQLLKNPETFYKSSIKPLLVSDAYRTYDIQLIGNLNKINIKNAIK
jgi:hypothetical protein